MMRQLQLLLQLLGYYYLVECRIPHDSMRCEVPLLDNASLEKVTKDGTTPLLERNVPAGMEVSINCHPGYSIENGPDRLVCLPLGMWSGRFTECRPAMSRHRIGCPIPMVENGDLRAVSPRRRLGRKLAASERVAVGTRIHLRCDRDFFITEGSYESTCAADGVWTTELAKCIPLLTEEEECGEDPKVAFGTIVARTIGTRTIECQEGYGLVGSGIVRCMKSGVWSYVENACQRICGKVPSIENGYISDGTNFAGSKREVGCFGGYEMRGSNSIECNIAGTWSSAGVCEKTCGEPPVIMNGRLPEGSSAIGAERAIQCDNGYALTGVSTILCNVNARWVIGGICKQACGKEPPLLNGAIEPGPSAVGSERLVTCDVGFVLRGPSTIRCGEDALWSEPGFCKKESIHMAAELGDVDAVKYLIKSMPELLESTRSAYGDSPLWRAAHNGQLEIVQLLLREGANIESKGLYGRTPLHEAAALGHVDVVKELVKAGANVYAVSNQHDSEDMPIHLAAFDGHLEVVRALADQFPDLVDKKDMHGRTPMDLAKMSTHDRSSDIVRYLKTKICDGDPVIANGLARNGTNSIGSERHIQCNDGFSLIGANSVRCRPGGYWSEGGSCARRQCVSNPTIENGVVGVEGGTAVGSERTVTCVHGFVLAGPSTIRCDANAQWTTSTVRCEPSESIFWAATMGHEQVVKVLIEKRPELIEERDRTNTTVLATAASYGQSGIVEFLLSKPMINLEAKDKDGRTALALAASKGHLRVVKMLVKRGADFHARSYMDDYEDLPIHFASLAGHSDVVEFLVQTDRGQLTVRNRDGDTPLHRAVVGGHVNTVRALLDLGSNIEARNSDGWTPLCHAAAEGNLDIVRMLYDRGANVYARSNADDDEDMPIHLAAYFGHLQVVNFLIDRKHELLFAKNRENESPINRAAVGGHTSVVEYLLSRGVGIETTGFRGRTPLHEAASKGHLKLVKLLVRHGANVSARSDRDTDRGSLPIHLASYFGQLDVVRYLIEVKPELADARNSRGQTPLEHAVAGGSLHHAQEVVRFLTDKVDVGMGPSLLP